MKWISYQREKDSEITEEDILASAVFLLIMIYLFIGIAFASDIFMNAIEKICGSTKTIKITNELDGVVVSNSKSIPIWNDTVANLTLMALGSSAPEILLSVIETVEGLGQQNPGDLGPGTIVGSAAFNLLVITAVCITSLASGRTSRIKLYKVFGFTALTSLFAYIWMVVVLEWNTKDQVDLWEALATLAFFPLLVIIAYWVDRDFCIGKSNTNKRLSTDSGQSLNEDGERNFYFGDDSDNLYDNEGNVNKDALNNLYHKLELLDLSPDEITQILATKLIESKQHSPMWYRSQVTRYLMGGAKLTPVLNEKLNEVLEAINESSEEKRKSEDTRRSFVLPTPSVYETKAVVEFQAISMVVQEAVGTATIYINRTGKQDVGFNVDVETFDGTARKDMEYESVKTTVSFEPDVNEAEVNVVIIDNVQWNPDVNFYMKLSVPPEFEAEAAIGQTHIIEIIIQDDDKPGKLSFGRRGYIFKPSMGFISVDVERHGGTDGDVTIEWKVIPGPECTIVKEEQGELEFKHNETKKLIDVFIHQSKNPSKVNGDKEKFDIALSNPTGGVKLGKRPKTTVAISNNTGYKLEIEDVIQAALQISEEADEEQSYKDQILHSFMVNGGDCATATWKDYIFHIINFPYKVVFSFIPPPHILGGWATFFLALAAVGLLTKVVGEAATSFGMAIGLDPVITAITFVALGTSLPDTFASRISAINDKTADNAVGNVTGSNSVNVFLGLGIPWTLGALFYQHKPNDYNVLEPYCVLAGSLTFNVLVYTICAAISIFILTIRRYSSACGKAELGGPSKWQWATAIPMFLLWIAYIAASSAQVVLYDGGNGVDISDPFKGATYGDCQNIIEKSKQNRDQ